MIGGRWANTTRLAHKEVWLCDLFEPPVENNERTDDAYLWLKERIGELIRFESYFDVGYDESVCLSSYCDIDESFIPDGVEDAINECPLLTDEEKEVLMEKVEDLANDGNGYKFYEIDY